MATSDWTTTEDCALAGHCAEYFATEAVPETKEQLESWLSDDGKTSQGKYAPDVPVMRISGETLCTGGLS